MQSTAGEWIGDFRLQWKTDGEREGSVKSMGERRVMPRNKIIYEWINFC